MWLPVALTGRNPEALTGRNPGGPVGAFTGRKPTGPEAGTGLNPDGPEGAVTGLYDLCAGTAGTLTGF